MWSNPSIPRPTDRRLQNESLHITVMVLGYDLDGYENNFHDYVMMETLNS